MTLAPGGKGPNTAGLKTLPEHVARLLRNGVKFGQADLS